MFREALTFDDVQIVPRYSEVPSRSQISLFTELTRNYTIDTPFISAPMDSVTGVKMALELQKLGAVGAIHRFNTIEEECDIVKAVAREVVQKRHPIVASIGVSKDDQHRVDQLLAAGANVLLIDVAHGDHKNVKDMMEWLNKFPNRGDFDVIAGNIATIDAAERLESWGADALRVGIGGGSMCTTRVRTGVGVPQFTAIYDIAQIATVPVIADGGIRGSGDAAKALAAGACSVMIGSLLAGTNEAPGDEFVTGDWPHEKRFKVYRGSASMTIKLETRGEANNVEGTATMVPVKGKASKVIKIMSDGIQSAMSYAGVSNISDFQSSCDFVRITNAGHIEATPHGLR